MYALHLSILFLERPLHLKVRLPFFLDPLLLHIAYDASMHCLTMDSKQDVVQYQNVDLGILTAFSACCW